VLPTIYFPTTGLVVCIHFWGEGHYLHVFMAKGSSLCGIYVWYKTDGCPYR